VSFNNTEPSQKQIDTYQKNALNKTLNKAKPEEPYSYNATETSSNNHKTSQIGWCYIGEERGYRTCSQVGKDDVCMSGDIFPSQEICINPTLRA
jgi:hypothetical protein